MLKRVLIGIDISYEDLTLDIMHIANPGVILFHMIIIYTFQTLTLVLQIAESIKLRKLVYGKSKGHGNLPQ
jgi:hypothetical protein